ncbi:hypothetical protein HYC85_032020 [Camellia sinensis]|uniref:Germin-like protein n=1 Tax=Camellia sinensis TaxID=4442 RepID=A0A7J7FSR8_CAMSI|nr:hypothetical protein HYC85_032020 [Camellia sinensis]
METSSHSRECVDSLLTQLTHQTSRSQKPAWLSSWLSTARACPWQSFNSRLAALTHSTPTLRSAELLFVMEGSVEVGFVDIANKLYTQTLQLGDMFVFPKGLVHYQYNADSSKQATAISAFGSANAGTVSAPVTLFATGIDDVVLAKSFKTDVGTIQKIKAGLAAEP